MVNCLSARSSGVLFLFLPRWLYLWLDCVCSSHLALHTLSLNSQICDVHLLVMLLSINGTLDSLPARASEQGNVIGSVRIYIYNISESMVVLSM